MQLMTKTTSSAAALSTRIQQHLSQLPQAEKRLADMILESPGHMASYSASEISKMAGVSNATMTRLVQRLGYQNYDQMRRLARQGQDWGSPLYLLDRPEQNTAEDGADLYEQHIASSTQNIRGTFAGISPTLINEIGKKIATARQVRIFGQRNNYFFASYLRWQFIQFRSNVYVLPVSGETIAEYLVGLEPEDLFIVFGLRRRNPLLADLIAAVSSFGVKTLLITDSSNRGDLGADWVLKCDTKSPIPLDNHTAVMALCHVLSAQVIEKVGNAGRQRLVKIEELHAALREL
ncbi:transcriptional regulator, RpiR family [Collimonas sp. OK307]|nr:transcriptional regulator, RpiR family [Collimonas sp. OK307]